MRVRHFTGICGTVISLDNGVVSWVSDRGVKMPKAWPGEFTVIL